MKVMIDSSVASKARPSHSAASANSSQTQWINPNLTY